ncbi:hypothetical protein K7432_007429 [Basidiobolus ranarum]|uniref:F-box domain-containing protein n=1 Tax=Basidiobolus ranarum TaxID=34480 RepID=A0ABR2WTG9_9FUNG
MIKVHTPQTSQLPSECVHNLIRLVRNDMKTLYSISLVSRSWSTTALKYLYQDPWSYFPFDDWGYSGHSQRIALLLSTLLSPLDAQDSLGNKSICPNRTRGAKPSEQKYLQLLTTLDLYWIKKAFRLISTKDFGDTQGNLHLSKFREMGEKLFSYLTQYKPRQLERLTLLDCQGFNTFHSSLVSLQFLDIRQRTFDSSTAKRIQELCPNLVQLRITALLVDDVVTAELIKRMKKNTLHKLWIHGMLKSITLIVRTLIQCHPETLEELSVNMNPGNIQEDVVDPCVNSGILELSQLPNLRSLSLKGMYVNTELVTDIAQQCTQLSRVCLSGPYVATGAAETMIVQMGERLLELTLNIEERCLGRALILLNKHCPNLQKLDIAGMEFDCGQITQLAASCSELTHVTLGHPVYASTKTYHGMIETLITNCHKLVYLNLNRIYVGTEIIPSLLKHSNLRKLVLPIPLLRSPCFNRQIIQFNTVILGEQGVFELYLTPI